ncbi:uncharacterized protein LOC124437764 [Xenia sp. Carnegie-2017]|uniref:uncharacterized protein LOC124437764 n=1 Tax=Xenia sp. Carnegie-2017 TaxID=2897299 RepID=UPI001F041EC8|nr:uncharacterized protein LOC124437764 [Xenia sp. Carnegie-2017]
MKTASIWQHWICIHNTIYFILRCCTYKWKNEIYDGLPQNHRNLTNQGSTLCWGDNVNASYRFYEHGLHFGSPSLGKKRCHLANDENEVMLKSHYTVMEDGTTNMRWDRAQFGFLKSTFLQVPCKRIAVWIR